MKRIYSLLLLAVLGVALAGISSALAADLVIQKVSQTASIGSLDGVPFTTVTFSVQTNVKTAGEKMSLWIDGQDQSTAIIKDPSGEVKYTDGTGTVLYFKDFSFDNLQSDTIYHYSVTVHDETLAQTVMDSGLFRTIPEGSEAAIQTDKDLANQIDSLRPEYVAFAENDLDALRISDQATKAAFVSCAQSAIRMEVNDITEFSIDGNTFVDFGEVGHFICRGFDSITKALGSGERHAVIRDYFNALGFSRIYWDDVQKISSGIKPVHRNLAKEQANVPTALTYFKKIFGHSPVFTNQSEDLAWNTLMYRIRFPRNLALEAAGITKFRQIFFRSPSSPVDWSAVRILGYVKN